MSGFFRLAIRLVMVLCAGLSVLLILLWLTGFLKDAELDPEAIAILEILEKPDLPVDENRFYYLIGFEAPSSYAPQVWGKMLFDEQKQFYTHPENIADEFDFFQEHIEFKNSAVTRNMLQAETASYKTIWEGMDELFVMIDAADFTVQLKKYFSSLESQEQIEDLAQGRRNMFVQRFRHARNLPRSRPVTMESFRDARLNTWNSIIRSHQFMLLDACNRFLDEKRGSHAKEMALEDVLLDLTALQQWLQSSSELLEFAIVRRLLTDSMEISMFLLKECNRDELDLSREESLRKTVIASGELLVQFVPREAIAREFKYNNSKLTLWGQSQKQLKNYFNLTRETLEMFGDETYRPPLMVRILLACPEKYYPQLINVFLKTHYTQNLSAEGFQILMNLDSLEDDFLQNSNKLSEQASSVMLLYNRLYNPLGSWSLLESIAGTENKTPAQTWYDFLGAWSGREKVLELLQQARYLPL